MKKYILLLVIFFFIGIKFTIAHSVQVAYCISCDGKLRLYVEHWHGNASPTSTTMTLEVTVNGVTTASTGSPVDNIIDIPFAQLPNCASPPVIFASCTQANTYNDWVVYDFPGIPTNATAKIKIISGNSAFTDDGCGMFPAETNNFIVSPINQPPITVPSVFTCSGVLAPAITFPAATPAGGTYIWTNDNPAIGIPANGSGNIPAFTPPLSNTTQVANISLSYLCSSTTFSVTVLPSAGPNYNFVNIVNSSTTGADPNVQCLGDPTQFQSQFTPGIVVQSFVWDFGDGSPTSTELNPTHLFQNIGNYYVSLEIVTADGCTQTSTSLITVHPKPVANFTSTPECEYDAVDFTNTSTIATGAIVNWNWSFGDGTLSTIQNPSHLYGSDGNYPVNLLVVSDAGCVNLTTKNQVTYKKPLASFSATSACETKSTYFTDASTSVNSISSYAWDYENDGITDNLTSNPSHIYTALGNYNAKLTVTDNNGCVDDTINNIIVNALPDANFTYTSVCPGFSSDFTDASSIAGGNPIASWHWDIDNNGTVESNAQNISNIWNNGGSYNVELKVISSEGCEDSLVKSILIYPKPNAAFSHTTVCFGTRTNFTDNSSVAMNNAIVQWEWNFDDLNTSSNQNPTNNYAAHGLYNTTLMIETNNGCRDTVANQVEVYSKPNIDFSMLNVCEYDKVNFVNNTTIPSGENMTYVWSFGDNSFLNIQSPLHKYSTEGVYAVNLQATSTHNCVSDSTINVEIYDQPSAQFNLVNGCVYHDFTFTDNSSTTSTISSWQWNYSDGSSSTMQSPTHNFISEGIYQIQLVVTTSDQCKDTNVIDLEVYPKPVADFTPNDVCLSVLTNFQDISTISTQYFPSEYILPYSSWSFGDGTFASGPATFHTYNTAGSYNAQIIVTSNHNCKDTAEKIVLVHSNPIASFVTTDSEGCSPLTSNFENTSTITNTPLNYTLSYKWYLDNQTESNLENVTSTFINENNNSNQFYGGSLVVTSNYGCKDSIYNASVISVHPIPFPDFSFAPEETNVYNTLIDFSDLSIVATKWNWNLGDGSLENQKNPTHTYADSGTYIVNLRIENQYACVDSVSKTLVIDPVYNLYIPNSITPNGDGVNDVFMVDGYGISKQQMYIYDKWGKLLFESSKIGEGWDGYVNGKLDKIAVYIYVINIEDLFGKAHNYKGSLTVIR